MTQLAPGIFRVTAQVGFMETPHVPTLLREAQQGGLEYRLAETTFFLGRENVAVTRPSGMAPWRKRLFAFMSRNAQRAPLHYGIPANMVIEIGFQVDL